MKRAEFGKEPEDSEVESLKNARSVAAPTFIAEHTVKAGETLSHIALQYYGSAETEKWKTIYEANKAAIGDNPAVVRPGTVLKIPKLPA